MKFRQKASGFLPLLLLPVNESECIFMKRVAALLSSLTLLSSFSLPANAKTEYKQVTVDVPPKIVFLGDSIATGYGLDGYKEGKENCNSYANQLAKKYNAILDGKCETSSENLAIDGQTSTELLDALKSGEYDDVLKNADAIVVSIGGNDLLSVLWNQFRFDNKISDNPDTDEKNFDWSKLFSSLFNMNEQIDQRITVFDSNISQIAKTIKTKTYANLVIQTLYNPFDSFEQVKQIQSFLAEKIKSLNDCIISHKNDDDASYSVADVYSEFYGKGNELTRIQSMDIHPNQNGHNVIFECVDKTIRLEKYNCVQDVETKPVQSASISDNKTNCIVAAGLAAVVLGTAVFVFIKAKDKLRKDK